jgi:hypothetical protein
LHVLAFQTDVTPEAPRQPFGVVERGLDRDVIDAAVQDQTDEIEGLGHESQVLWIHAAINVL